MADKQIYPMFPEKSWWLLREQFKKTIPTTVNVSYLKSLLSLTADQAARNLMSPLRQMGIIDDKDRPTTRANEWRNDAKYKEVCTAITKEIYKQELLDLFPDEDIDSAAAKLWFMDTAGIGDSAASKVTSLFILLKTGVIRQDVDNVKSQTKTKSVVRQSNKTKPDVMPKSKPTNDLPQSRSDNSQPLSNQPSMHIDLQIHISPEATAEQIDKIFASIAKHLYAAK